MRFVLALAIGVSAVAVAAPCAAQPAAPPAQAEDARFAAFGETVVDQFLKFDPVGATQLGDHRYDSLLPDVSAEGRARRRAFVESSLAELAKFDRGRLSREHQVDAI